MVFENDLTINLHQMIVYTIMEVLPYNIFTPKETQ